MKPLIFITNDDGIQSKGIQCAVQMAKKFGDVIVVAPNGPRSAQSSAITVEIPIFIEKVKEEEGCVQYACSGTPVDCVKLGLDKLADRHPDLLISGINHGSNTSINVVYSGTMGAAIEGSLHSVTSMGLSYASHDVDADLTTTIPYFESILKFLLSNKLPHGVCLNVNAPMGEIKGMKICRQSHGHWEKEFLETEIPRTKNYYWLVGEFMQDEPNSDDTDNGAIKNGYISIVPTQTNMTAYDMLSQMKKLEI